MPEKFSLFYHIAKRTITMFPRRKKSIRLLYLDNHPVEGHDNLILLKYKFSNAIYYGIGGNKVVSQEIIMEKPAEGQQIPFTVFGLAKQNDYVLSVTGGEVVLTRLVQKARPATIVTTSDPYYLLSLTHN